MQRDGEIYVHVVTVSGKSAYVSVRRDATAGQTLALAARDLPKDLAIKRLLFKGKIFAPEDSLASKGVTEMCRLVAI